MVESVLGESVEWPSLAAAQEFWTDYKKGPQVEVAEEPQEGESDSEEEDEPLDDWIHGCLFGVDSTKLDILPLCDIPMQEEQKATVVEKINTDEAASKHKKDHKEQAEEKHKKKKDDKDNKDKKDDKDKNDKKENEKDKKAKKEHKEQAKKDVKGSTKKGD